MSNFLRRTMKSGEFEAGRDDIVAATSEHNSAGQYAEALALIDRALERGSRDAALLVARGTTLYEWGRVLEARETLSRAQALGARSADLPLKLGWCCAATGKHAESVQWMTSAVGAHPDSLEARFGLATVLSNVGRAEESGKQLEFVLARDPRHYQSLIQLGEQKLSSKHFDEAETLFRRAIAAEPGNPIGWLTLTSVLYVQGRSSEAAEAIETAHRLEAETGNDIETFISLGVVKSDAGLFDEARRIFEANLAEKPSPDAHVAYAFVLLRLGYFRDGWEHYEFRLMRANRISDRPRYGKPPWTGQPLQGRTILLRREQGFGDAIQFVRYAPMIKALGATVWLQVDAAMQALAKGFDGVDRVFADGETLPDFDYYVHLPSLPRLFSTELATIPSHVPYLRANDDRLAKWKQRVGEISDLKVGFVWAGHPNHLRDWERSIALKMLMPLAEIEGVRFYSLQKGAASGEIGSLVNFPLEDLSTALHDFADTAAAIQQMDLIISVDTAVAHLAGAMAKPVWLLLPKACDFRWLESRADSPWYPTMRLFRQEHGGDWDSVVRDVAAALRQRVEDRRDATTIVAQLRDAMAAPAREKPASLDIDLDTRYSAFAETRVGVIQYLPNDRSTAESIRRYGEYLQPMIDAIVQLIPAGATILEAGAGIGMHALTLAAKAAPNGHLILYEDRPLHRRLLHQNIAANSLSNVTIMRRPLTSLPAGGATETVDQLALDRLDLFKINSPYSALEIIQGAADTIWRLRPLLVLLGVDVGNLLSLKRSTSDFGYRAFRADISWFNAQNFNRRREDFFGGRSETVILAVPEERDRFVPPAAYRDMQ